MRAGFRPAPAHHQPSQWKRTSLLLGVAVWCFVFGYFMGAAHKPSNDDGWSSTQRVLNLVESSPEPAEKVPEVKGFPMCDAQEEKLDAVNIYSTLHLKPPPSLRDEFEQSTLQVLLHTRETLRQGIGPASLALSSMYDWCDMENQRRFYLSMPPPIIGFETISFVTLQQLWFEGLRSPHVKAVHCEGFNPHCGGANRIRLTPDVLLQQFQEDYIRPKFYPSLPDVGALVKGNSFADMMREVMVSQNWDELVRLSRGNNADPPEIGVMYGGLVTKYGSIVSPYLTIPGWPDEPREDWPKFVNEYMAHNTTEKWKDVKEVFVITHHHHDMFWHWLISEAYRLLVVLPFLQAHPDIFIHIAAGPAWAQKYEWMFNIPRWRFIGYENVRADVVYTLQNIERSEVPSLGMARLIRQGMLDLEELPPHEQRSVLAAPRGAQPQFPNGEVVVNVVFIVRTDPFGGRIIVNHRELLKEFEKLGSAYSAKLAERARTTGHPLKSLRFELVEHFGKMSMAESRRLFSRADIVIGPHGAGFAHLYAARPGTHVLELFAGRHLNIFTAARLGLGYHAIVSETTTEGLNDGALSKNFISNIPQLLQIVESILDQRFLPS